MEALGVIKICGLHCSILSLVLHTVFTTLGIPEKLLESWKSPPCRALEKQTISLRSWKTPGILKVSSMQGPGKTDNFPALLKNSWNLESLLHARSWKNRLFPCAPEKLLDFWKSLLCKALEKQTISLRSWKTPGFLKVSSMQGPGKTDNFPVLLKISWNFVEIFQQFYKQTKTWFTLIFIFK